jgi:S-adenosyl-L-methionine hydrolase (adenosine-forming)
VARPVVFLTDYGSADEFVGVCHAVIARLAPEARVIDLAHGIPPGDVLAGAVVLASAVPYAPEDSVYLAVVDPGVGTERRGLALQAGRAVLVGPDNGILSLAADALGGIDRVVAIDPDRVAPGPISATFHGRDVFAPAVAMLAAGVLLEDLGDPADPASVGRVVVEEPVVERGRLETAILGVDRFGNVRLAARPEHLGRAGLGELVAMVRGEDVHPVRVVRTFADLGPDELGLLEDSGGWLALVRNGSSAAESLGVVPYDRVILSHRDLALG